MTMNSVSVTLPSFVPIRIVSDMNETANAAPIANTTPSIVSDPKIP